MTTRKTRTRVFLGSAFGSALAILLLGAAPAPALSQDFAPAVVVNDEIITGYDIDQRQRLLTAASGGAAVTRDDAVEQLINDILRVQAARRAGITPTPEQIAKGFADLSNSQGRDPQAMRRYFLSRGVTEKHLDKQIAAEVAWRELIPSTYMRRIRITDTDIDEARDAIPAAPTGGPEYLLSEIRLPIDTRGPQAMLAEANGLLQQLQGGGVTFGDLARQRSSGTSAATGGDLGWVSLSTLSPAMQSAVGPMKRDRVSAPFVDGNEVVLIGVRNTRGQGGITPASYRISQLVVGVAPDAAPSIASLALQKARAARARVTDCASIEALKAEYLPISGDIGTLTPDQMPGAVRNTVVTLPVGGISEPIRSNDGFHVLVLCDKIESGAGAAPATSGAPDDTQVRRGLVNSKLARYSASLLRKLRREAVIERR